MQPDSSASRNLSTIAEASASPEVQKLYQRFRDKFGRADIPGIVTCFATHPTLLEHMLGLAETMLFTDGALGRMNKELIATFVSAHNRCEYCADSHGASFMRCGGSAEQLVDAMADNVTSPSFDEAHRLLLSFVRKITENAAGIEPSDIEQLRAAGWKDLQIAETIHVAALYACFNRIVDAFGLPSQELIAKSHLLDSLP